MPLDATMRQRFLLWLAHLDALGQASGGVGRTQAGLADRLQASRSHVSRTADDLKSEGLLTHGPVRVPGFRRTMKGYHLTPAGAAEAANVAAALRGQRVPVRRAGEEAGPMALGKVLDMAAPRRTLWDLVEELDEHGAVDVDRPAPSPRAGAAASLEGLPPEQPFGGRAQELGVLQQWLDGPRRPVCLLTGLGGTGKSALAAVLARGLRARRTVAWLEATSSLGPADLAAVLSRTLSRMGRPGPSLDALGPGETAALKDRMKGLPLLVVVDAFEHASPDLQAAVQGVLDGGAFAPPAKLLVVGRTVPLRAAGAAKVHLQGLDPAEAGEVLRACGPNAGTDVAALGTNPAVLAAWGTARPGSGAAALRAAVLKATDPGQRELLQALACCPGPVPEEVLATVVPGAEGSIDALGEAGVLRSDGMGHELPAALREALVADLRPAERKGLHRRFAQAYLADPARVSRLADGLDHLLRADMRREAQDWLLRRGSQVVHEAETLFEPEPE